ncbi:hypothetical protein [Undibacterium rugosum]|uniref:hypothetical protein n=1 Tax=Undibacterium rugosum TaxID=2762291 RepID=UPI001B81EAC5|nr:hypothetical protein [Undibacterium rugosum]MBR7779322.1 hypothetical protein [Undibacterium rugosum]
MLNEISVFQAANMQLRNILWKNRVFRCLEMRESGKAEISRLMIEFLQLKKVDRRGEPRSTFHQERQNAFRIMLNDHDESGRAPISRGAFVDI